MKVVINKCFGGFQLSLKAQKLYCEKKGIGFYPYERTHYKFKDGKDEYKYVENLNRDNLFIDISNTFLGEKCSDIPNENYWWYGCIDRNDSDLIKTVEELGEAANGSLSSLKIVDIPDDIEWEIDDYDGIETVHEKHRSW